MTRPPSRASLFERHARQERHSIGRLVRASLNTLFSGRKSACKEDGRSIDDALHRRVRHGKSRGLSGRLPADPEDPRRVRLSGDLLHRGPAAGGGGRRIPGSARDLRVLRDRVPHLLAQDAARSSLLRTGAGPRDPAAGDPTGERAGRADLCAALCGPAAGVRFCRGPARQSLARERRRRGRLRLCQFPAVGTGHHHASPPAAPLHLR